MQHRTAALPEPRAAIFLDRDGTLNRELETPVAHPGEIEYLPGAVEACAALAQAGFALVVATNQSAIARGTLRAEQLFDVHAALRRDLLAGGAPLAGLYVCPHHPDAGAAPYRRACSCRKPQGGLVARALRELALDASRSFVVGDALRDLRAGAACGVRGILVRTGKGEREAERADAAPPLVGHVARDLAEASRWILARQGR